MEFLKGALGEKYDEFCNLIAGHNEKNPDNAISIINAKDGSYIENEKYPALCEKYEKDPQELKNQIEKVKFDMGIDNYLKSQNPKNLKAVKALLDLESIKFDDGLFTGLSEQVQKLKKEEAYLFEGENVPQFTRPVGKTDGDITRDEYKKLSYMEKLKLKKESPDIYTKLK